MTEADTIAFWHDGALRALTAAKHLQESEDYEIALFTCHLAAEKALKYVCVKKTRSTPPKTHNLLDLCVLADIELNNDQKTQLRELTSFAEFGRYGDDSWLEVDATADNVAQWIATTDSYVQSWLH